MEPRSLSHAPVCCTWPQCRRCSWAAAVQRVCTQQTGSQGRGRGALKPRGRNTAPEVCDSSCQRPGRVKDAKTPAAVNTLGALCTQLGKRRHDKRARGEGLPDTLVEKKSCAQLQHTEPLITPEHKAPTRPSARRAINTRANAESRKLITTHSRLPKRLRKSGTCTPAWTIQATLRMRTVRISRLQQ